MITVSQATKGFAAGVLAAALMMVVLGCTPRTESAEEIFAAARVANSNVESFRMTWTYSPQLPGSTGITSLEMIWQQPDVLLTTVYGNGSPEFQQGFQRAGDCLRRESKEGAWEAIDTSMCSQRTGPLQLDSFLEGESAEIVEHSDDMVTVRRTTAPVPIGEPESPGISIWLLEFDRSDHLVREVEGFEEGSETARLTIDVSEYNADLKSEISGLNLPTPK